MSIEIVMPRLSDTMEEGTIVKWLKQVGDRVAVGDVVAEVETDKATMELEAFDAGVLTEFRVAEGQAAPVGAVIAVLDGGEAAVASPRPVEPAPAARPGPAAPAAPAPAIPMAPPRSERARPPAPPHAGSPSAPSPPPGERARVSPRARRLASERGVDLGALRGSGPDGRIVAADVESPGAIAAGPGRRVALGKVRRTTAARMAAAKRDVPHFYASSEFAADGLLELKQTLRARGDQWRGVTLTPLLAKAVGLALREVPELNASWAGDAVDLHAEVNVGLAVAVDDGLVVPVLRGCDVEPLDKLVAAARGLVERARAGRFAGDDLLGATFTLSNLGMYPVSTFAAVVNPPHAGILAVGTVRRVPVVRGTAVVPGDVLGVTLSCDHRVVDGVTAGRFLAALKRCIEAPSLLLG